MTYTWVEWGENFTNVAYTNSIGKFVSSFVISKGKYFTVNFLKVLLMEQRSLLMNAFSMPTVTELIRVQILRRFVTCLPRYTTHLHQPLGRSFIKPLKTYHAEENNNLVRWPTESRNICKFILGFYFKICVDERDNFYCWDWIFLYRIHHGSATPVDTTDPNPSTRFRDTLHTPKKINNRQIRRGKEKHKSVQITSPEFIATVRPKRTTGTSVLFGKD
jgi:hypothetical protein